VHGGDADGRHHPGAYAYSNEDAEPFGLSTAAIYADLAKPFAEQFMDIRHEPISPEPTLYRAWNDAQQG